jgi:hypothetical protein
MKAHADINDTLREAGPDAVRARHDAAHKLNGKRSKCTINETLDVFKHWLLLRDPTPVLAVLEPSPPTISTAILYGSAS